MCVCLQTIMALSLVLKDNETPREPDALPVCPTASSSPRSQPPLAASAFETQLAKLEPVRRSARSGGIQDATTVTRATSATLVVCPVVAVIQWQHEIRRFTPPGSLRVMVYHGSGRAAVARALASSSENETADIVLTTYSTLEVDYRKFMLPSKVTCKYCGKRLYPDRYKVQSHYAYICIYMC